MQKTLSRNIIECLLIFIVHCLFFAVFFILIMPCFFIGMEYAAIVFCLYFFMFYCRNLFISCLFDKFGVYEELRQRNYLKLILGLISDILILFILDKFFFVLAFASFTVPFLGALFISCVRNRIKELSEKQKRFKMITSYVLYIVIFTIIVFLSFGIDGLIH